MDTVKATVQLGKFFFGTEVLGRGLGLTAEYFGASPNTVQTLEAVGGVGPMVPGYHLILGGKSLSERVFGKSLYQIIKGAVSPEAKKGDTITLKGGGEKADYNVLRDLGEGKSAVRPVDIAAKVDALTVERDRVQGEFDQTSGVFSPIRKSELKNQLDVLNKQISGLKTDHAALSRENIQSDLSGKQSDRDKERAHLAGLEQERVRTTDAQGIDEIGRDISASRKKIAGLDKDIEGLENNLRTAKLDWIKTLPEDATARREAIVKQAATTPEFTTFKAKAQGPSASAVRPVDIAAKVDALTVERDRVQGEFDQTSGVFSPIRKSELKNQLDVLNKQISGLKTDHAALSRENIQSDLSGKQSDRDKERAHLAGLEQERVRTTDAQGIDEIGRDISASRKKIAGLDKDIEGLENNLRTAKLDWIKTLPEDATARREAIVKQAATTPEFTTFKAKAQGPSASAVRPVDIAAKVDAL